MSGRRSGYCGGCDVPPAVHDMTRWGFGARIGNVALFCHPVVHLAGHDVQLFDVGVDLGICAMAAMLVWSSLRHTIELYQADRLP